MIRPHSFRWVVILLSLLTGCTKEPSRMDNYWVDLATVLLDRDQLSLQLDNNQIVVPDQPIHEDLETGQRVIINYTPITNNLIQVHFLRKIFTGGIQPMESSHPIPADPVKVRSVWLTERHINLVLEIEYHHTPHSFGLYRDLSNVTEVDLHLGHSNEGDSPGYWQVTYLSFSLHNLSSPDKQLPCKLTLHTYEGIRIFQFNKPKDTGKRL